MDLDLETTVRALGSNVVGFPSRRSSAVFVTREALGGFLVVVRSYGWLFGSFHEARDETQRLAANLGVPIRLEVGRRRARQEWR